MKSVLFIAILLLSLLFTSCITVRKLTYLQKTGISADTVAAAIPEDYKIQPFDNLFIRVATPDPKWADMFNTMQTNSSGINVTEQSADLISYSVDTEGNIELPYAGKVRVAGKTLGMIKPEIENTLKAYVADASITVKLVNNFISILGEVRTPGRYLIYKDRMNVFEALALAGDLDDFSNRQKLQIIRQIEGGSIVREFSINDRNILASEFYYVMPNDVIYAEPVKGRFFRMNEFPYSVILSTITTFILILSFIK
jgi:polysaccharide export outer membrane protein